MENEILDFLDDLSLQVDEASSRLEVCTEAFAKCESPIERKFLLAYLNQYPICTAKGKDVLLFVDKDAVGTWVSFAPQLTISLNRKRFRLDFLFMQMNEDEATHQVTCLKNVVVELDGHDFHERTKEQARHDRSRDRMMLQHGYYVLRFTGSEVFKNAASIAGEIRKFVLAPTMLERPHLIK